MTKRRGFKRWIAGLSALVMLLTIGLALPVGARAEKNTVRVLLTRLNLIDRLEIALDGSYTLDEIAFQRGTHLKVSCASGSRSSDWIMATLSIIYLTLLICNRPMRSI